MSTNANLRTAARLRHVRLIAPVVRSGCAWILTVLIALPFTAPFPTCTAAILLAPSSVSVPVASQAPVVAHGVARNDASATPDEESFKDVTVVEIAEAVARPEHHRSTATSSAPTSVVRTPLVALRL
jgi:hypothetical protein